MTPDELATIINDVTAYPVEEVASTESEGENVKVILRDNNTSAIANAIASISAVPANKQCIYTWTLL